MSLALIEVSTVALELTLGPSAAARRTDPRPSQNRLNLRGYNTPKDFDMDMLRLFEKGRRWFEEGSKDYGRVLILQRLYQGLTSSAAAAKLLNKTAPHNFASIPAGPGVAQPLHSATSTSETAVTTYRIQNKDRTFHEEAVFKGTAYRSGDYVHVMNPNDPTRPIIAQVFKCWKPDQCVLYDGFQLSEIDLASFIAVDLMNSGLLCAGTSDRSRSVTPPHPMPRH